MAGAIFGSRADHLSEATSPALQNYAKPLSVLRWYVPSLASARPLPGLAHLGVPELVSFHDVAELTGIDVDALDRFADLHRYNRGPRPTKLPHYHYRWLRKRSRNSATHRQSFG